MTKPQKTALTAFLLAMLVTQVFTWIFYERDRENEYLIVQQEAENVASRINEVLNSSIRATKTLAFLIENDLMTDELFNSLSAQLLAGNAPMDALQLVEGSFITQTYPLEGNEATIGYEVLADSVHLREAMEALERRQLYFDGPFNLRQGGRGVVGRLPVLKDDDYWGFTASLIRVETFIDAIGLNRSGRDDIFKYQIIKRGADSEYGQFFGELEGYDEGVYYRKFIPMGDWYVYVRLRDSGQLFSLILLSLFGLILSSTIAMFTYNLSAQPEKLQRQVDEKTRDLEQLNREIQEHVKELEISNQELEQFAYIASHDLQEPLRMITSFIGRLREKYGDRLDEKGLVYLGFASDGAVRMRRIILDLLEYSRVGREEDSIREIDLNSVLADYKSMHRRIISEKKAEITHDELPVITHYPAPVTIIFGNLIDNALKYSKPGVPPRIHIAAADKGEHLEFSIRDNGIGIEEEYHGKIFLIFNRLHARDVYEGSGIGLATIKKIMGNLNERIWLESVPGEGSTFYFTLKKKL
ncbi:MAG: CHASE domain-containing protein [Balneolia bacterium]|nr:CHASE domain-containing protein [Balneolia bacterium]